MTLGGAACALLALACEPSSPTESQSVEPAPEALQRDLAIPEVDGPHLNLVTMDGVRATDILAVRLDGRIDDAILHEGVAYATGFDTGLLYKVSFDGEVVDTLELGLGPRSVTALGKRAWVAISLQNEVVEIDLERFEIVDRFAVDGEPRWLHRVAQTLAVTTAKRDDVVFIDLRTDAIHSVALPGWTRDSVEQDLRVTGAGGLGERDGRAVLHVPVLYTDTSLSLPTIVPEVEDLPPPYYGNAPLSVRDLGRFVPAVVTLDMKDGTVLGSVATLAAAENARREPTVYGGAIRSVHQLGDRMIATMPGENIAMTWTDRGFGGRSAPGFIRTGIVEVEGGPYALHRAGHMTVIHTVLGGGLAVQAPGFWGTVATNNRALAPAGVKLTRETLPADVERGRRLFHSSRHTRVTLEGSGASCASCHMDGQSDGQTWHVDSGPRQTPSLGGTVSATAPMTWTEGVASLEHEIVLTSQGRMASQGDLGDAADLAAYVDSLPHPPSAATSIVTDLDEGAIARGEALFQGSAECASCHQGEALTDNQSYAMFDLAAVDTPTLHGLRATAPYLHDGRAPTLDALVDMAEAGGMGKTDHLSPAEKADLVAYLKSL